MSNRPTAMTGEFVGAAGLLLIAVSAIRVTAPGSALAGLDTLFDGRTLVVGCAIGAEVALFGITPLGHRSGAQLNPAVTLLMWLEHTIDTASAIVRVAAQVAGSLFGVALGRLVWGGVAASSQVRYGLLQPAPGLGWITTAAGEFAMTCVLLVAVLATARADRAGAAVLFAVIAAMIWLGGDWTGAGFNPIRNLAPAVFTGDFRFQLSYLLAPLLASVVLAGALSSRVTHLQKQSHNDKGRRHGNNPVAPSAE